MASAGPLEDTQSAHGHALWSRTSGVGSFLSRVGRSSRSLILGRGSPSLRCSVMPENAHATMSQADGVPMHCQDTHIRMRLDAAHDAGRKFRQRVQLPLICTGFVIVIVSLVAGTVSYAIIDSWTFHVGYVGLPAGLAMYLLALTPADDVLIRWTLYIFAGLLLVYAVIINVTTMDDYRALPVAGARRCSHALHGRVPCWWACTSVAISLFEALVCGMFAAQLLRYAVRAFSARARLEVLWKSGGQSAVTFGSCEAVRLVISASAGLMYMFAADSGVEFLGVDESTSSRSAMADGANPADVKLYFRIWIALIVSELFFGVLLLHGTYRSRVQAWLASRGEAVATAAGLASLLGNRPAPEVQALARSLFRYITLDALHFDDLADGKPNPRLYKLSQPAHFGTVDVFVSHSCAPRSAAARRRAPRERLTPPAPVAPRLLLLAPQLVGQRAEQVGRASGVAQGVHHAAPARAALLVCARARARAPTRRSARPCARPSLRWSPVGGARARHPPSSRCAGLTSAALTRSTSRTTLSACPSSSPGATSCSRCAARPTFTDCGA